MVSRLFLILRAANSTLDRPVLRETIPPKPKRPPGAGVFQIVGLFASHHVGGRANDRDDFAVCSDRSP